MNQKHDGEYHFSTTLSIAFALIFLCESSITFGQTQTKEYPMGVQNFLEEEDYESTETTTSSGQNPLAKDEISVPKFGEPGFGKGKPNPRKGTPRARVTAIDEEYLLFLATFTGASAEALSMIRERSATNLDPESGGFPTVKAVENRLRKLKKLGAVFSQRHAGTGVTSYSLTADGFGYLRSAGYPIDHGDTLKDTTLERLTHYKNIAQVAAMFAAGLFEDTLGVGSVPIENMISEKAMRQATAPIKAELKQLRAEGKTGDYVASRNLLLRKACNTAQQNASWSKMVKENPSLLTLPVAESAGKKFRGVYEPDLAVILDDGRKGTRAHNLLVEIELSRKSEAAYHAIFQSIAAETEKPYVYSAAVFMVVGPLVANRLKKVDAEGKYGLISSGRVKILPITYRDGTPLPAPNRITYGEN